MIKHKYFIIFRVEHYRYGISDFQLASVLNFVAPMNYFRESFGCLSCLFQVWKFSKVEFEKLSDFAPLMLSEFIEMFSPSCAYFTKLKCWKCIVNMRK